MYTYTYTIYKFIAIKWVIENLIFKEEIPYNTV